MANIVSLILGIVVTFLFPKFLDISSYGYYQLYIFYTGYIIITAFGISDGVQLKIAGIRYEEINFEEQNSLFWFSTFIQWVIYFILLMIIFLGFDNNDKRFVLLSACVVGFVVHPRYYLYTLLQGVGRLKEYAHIIITERSISIIISVIALILGYRDYKIMIICDVAGRVLSCLIAIVYCRKIVLKKPKITRYTVVLSIKYMLTGSMILFAMQTSNIIIGINRYGIEQQWGIEEFSKISLAIALSNMVLRCVNSISVVMFPTLRNVKNEELPLIYRYVNVILMTVIFVFMCFFKPLCYMIGMWLPQYAESLKYSILLLPICIYECKYSLLINTNLKNLNKEKSIGKINLISIIVCIVSAFLNIFFMKNIELTIIGIFVALSVRSMLGEILIGNIFKISVKENIISEFVISMVFIISNYYIDNLLSGLFYIICILIYMIVERDVIMELINRLKKI